MVDGGFQGMSVRTSAELVTTSLYLRPGQLVPGGRGIQVSLAIPEKKEGKPLANSLSKIRSPFPWQ